MGWKGTARSINSSIKRAAREAERESKRRQKELERLQKEQAKLDMLAQAAHEVEVFENLIDRLTTLHSEPFEALDWQVLSEEPPPTAPENQRTREQVARKAFETYKPSFFDKLFGKSPQKLAALESEIQKAINEDHDTNVIKTKTHEQQRKAWEDRVAFANRINDNDLSAYTELGEQLGLFEEIEEFGIQTEIGFLSDSIAKIRLSIHGEDIIPKEKKVLLQSGRLSVKNMPKGEFYEHFQDHVCSSALRVANETFAALPTMKEAFVDVFDNMLNTATGHIEDTAILSVRIPRATLEKINLATIDASDSMQNFVHHMNFKKTKGFAAVDSLPNTPNE